MKRTVILVVVIFALAASPAARGQSNSQNWPAPKEGDYTIRNFHFESGESLPELRLHYRKGWIWPKKNKKKSRF